MYSSAVLRQTQQNLIVQFTELQNLRIRVLNAEQRLFGRRRTKRRAVLGRRRLGRTVDPHR